MSSPAQTGFNIQATLFFAPEDTPRVLEALKPVYEQTIAEPECLSFQVYQLRDDPGQILLVEDWFVYVLLPSLKQIRARILSLTLSYRETPLDRYMTVCHWILFTNPAILGTRLTSHVPQ
jgi:hypothetical protein